MSLGLIDVETVYQQDKNLKKEDVRSLMEWANKQPHLPKINELQTFFFLHCCYYKNEAAKAVIDNFYTLRTRSPDMFKCKNPLFRIQTDLCLITVLPKQTPEGFIIVLITYLDSHPDDFSFPQTVRYFDMIYLLHLHQNGVANGLTVIVDYTKITFTHVLKAGPFNIKKFFFYLQEASPLRLRGLHFYNIVPFMDKVVALIKPFMKKEVMDVFHLHANTESLTKFIPLECLPEDFGGSTESIEILHGKIKEKLEENKPFFEWEEKLVVDDSKREEKLKNNDILGVDGTFKKLQID